MPTTHGAHRLSHASRSVTRSGLRPARGDVRRGTGAAAPSRVGRGSARRLGLPAAALALVVAAAVLSGCGSSSAPGSSVDPAGVVPAAAPLYVGATVRPTGEQKTAALDAGRALTHQADPYARLLAALRTPGSPPLDFSKEVAPWLGPQAGVFLTSLHASSALLSELEQGLLGESAASGEFPFGASGAQGAIVLNTSDAARANSFLATQAKRAGAHAAGYRGVAYQLTSGGVAFGMVARLAVIGSESGFRGVVDTSLGAASLAHSAEYSTLLAKAPAQALAHVYAAAAAAEIPGAQGLSGLEKVLAQGASSNISLLAAPNSLALDVDTLRTASSASAGGLLSADPQAVQGLRELPGESWLAVGLGHLDTTLSADVATLQALVSLTASATPGSAAGASGFGLSSLLGALTTPLSKLGADTPQAHRDYASWMGPGGIFASGAGLLELKAGVVITSKDAALSRAAVGKLGAELHAAGVAVQPVQIPGTEAAIAVRLAGLPLVLDVAAAHDSSGQAKFVLALGEASLTSALNPPSTMAGAASFAAAASALGEGAQPNVIVSFPTLLGLLEGVGLLEEPTIAKFVPYLRAATTLAGGGHELDANIDRYRLVLGLAPASG